MNVQKSRLLTATVALSLMVGSAHGAIITPTAATTNSTVGGNRGIENVIDGSDLSSNGLSGNILSETHDQNLDSGPGYWLSANGGGNVGNSTTLTFNLGGTFSVDGVHIWTYHRGGDNPSRAIESFDISFSTDGGSNYGSTINLSDWLSSQEAGYATVEGEIPVQSKSFATVEDVTHIKIDNIVNHGNAYIGLSEIRFNAVPEPGSLALIGLGGLCLLKRRRRDA